MAKKCDFLLEKGSKYYCLLKKDDREISGQTYNIYCKYDDTKRCPIYEHYYDERR